MHAVTFHAVDTQMKSMHKQVYIYRHFTSCTDYVGLAEARPDKGTS